MLKTLLTLLCSLLLTACSYPIAYDTLMTSVECRPTIDPSKKKVLASGIYLEPGMMIKASLNAQEILITIQNFSTNEIKILWDETRLVDHQGQAHPVMHIGVRYIARTEHQPPTIIPPQMKHEDRILNSDAIVYNEGYMSPGCYTSQGYIPGSTYHPGRWSEGELLPSKTSSQRRCLLLKKRLVGKILQLHLPLEIEGGKREYTLTFEIQNLQFSK